MSKSKDVKPHKDRFHWVLYHLEAMNYAKTKLKKKMSQLPSGQKLLKLDSKELRKIISQIKEVINWYKGNIEYHQEKAMSHIPDTEKTKWAKKSRELENKSYENIFLTADKLISDDNKKEMFKTYNESK